jgi:alpha-amylase
VDAGIPSVRPEPSPPSSDTHTGIPCIFWDHLFDWGPELKKTITDLLAVRKRNGIKAGSSLEILCAEADMYVARIGGK